MTETGDVILVTIEDQPAFFGRIEDIYSDVKPGWVRMKFLILQIPLTVGEWILRPEYIQGREFSMGGRKMRIEAVQAPPDQTPSVPDPDPGPGTGGKVIPLRKDRKKHP